ncbi:oocyte zinc finger protein XlCOF7.1-like [Bombina bombina]|uniref:oocyte zinc finger protein XlCOF7.1-like n=1 Tax=Bombina bombina TaxID=8345 RepID=UPI00235A7542|nr:oocyte zinc finger protein XlCOF7.1-like [Bombina bombina]
MNKYRKQIAEQFLSQALGIICLLTGEEYTIVKKRPSHSSIQQLSGEVPIKCDDVAVYFSMEEWEYIEGHEELYKDVMMETHQALSTMEITGNESSELTSHRDENLDTGAYGDLVQNIQPVETPSDVSAELTGHSDEHLDTGSHEELVQNVQPSDVSAGEKDAKISCNMEQTEDQWLSNMPEAAEQEICDNINTGESTKCNNPTYDQSADASLHHLQNQRSYVENVCSYCGKCFRKKSHLLTHLTIHTVENQFSCPICGKCFNLKNILVAHQQIHTGEKGFSCSDCGKCFTRKSHLIDHQKIHTGVKAFSCSECGKCFTWKSNLIRHQKIHTREKGFSCSECGRYFSQKSALVSHQKTHYKSLTS